MFCLGKHNFWYSELIKKFSMASLRAIYYLEKEFSAGSKISLQLCTGYDEFGLKAVKCILAFWLHLKGYELQTFILAWSFQSIHFSTSSKIEDKTHTTDFLKGVRFICSLVFEVKTFDFKKCFTIPKITKPRVIAHNPTKEMKQES